MIRMLIEEAVAGGARFTKACDVIGLPARTVQRWIHRPVDGRHGPRQSPSNKLSARERNKIVEIVTSPEFRDLSPKQIVALLADRRMYIGSESTILRVLNDAKLQHRRIRSRAPAKRPREHVASGSWQVASWDITYLKSHVRGQFYFLYLVVDVWSRKVLGWDVHESESSEHAARLIERVRQAADRSLEGWVLHSDNGGPMKGATMLATLQRLGIVPSFSRPRVSDDNPYVESLFRTLKYRPQYPVSGFATLDDASRWVEAFVHWYNHEHQHSSIGFVTPADRHAGTDVEILAARRCVYDRARRRHPERWSRATRSWPRPEVVTLNPELDLTA
jgi:putative transposase